MFVIDQLGNKLGVMGKDEALAKALEVDLDLILVSPNTKPPVAKILSWSKFKYQQEKRKKDNKGKSVEQKEIWFNTFIGEGDLAHKLKQITDFLQKKHSVKITIKARGRVTYLQEKDLLDRIIGSLKDSIEEIAEAPKHEGRHISLVVRPIKNKKVINNEVKIKNENQNTQSDSKKI